jgi:branched-subunit amino acid aminotransferase/4-amino-4-deoxychorismate lyase
VIQMADNVIQAIEHPNVTSVDWSSGAAYIDGAVMPLHEAKIPVTDWGYRRSDVTYDVVGVYFGAFFRLEDHLRRFRASMDKLRLKPRERARGKEQPWKRKCAARDFRLHAPPMSRRDGGMDLADRLLTPQVAEMSRYSAD